MEEVKNNPSEVRKGLNGWFLSEKKSFMVSLGITQFDICLAGSRDNIIDEIKFSNDGKISVV